MIKTVSKGKTTYKYLKKINKKVTMKALMISVAFSGFVFPVLLEAHGLKTESGSAKAAVLTVEYENGIPFSYEQYEIFSPGADQENQAPFQVGRTDANGRIIFTPDKSGTWTVKYTSDDGHGGKTEIMIDDSDVMAKKNKSIFERLEKMLSAAGFIVGLTGIGSLIYTRKKNKEEDIK
jgi:nickel transport protein